MQQIEKQTVEQAEVEAPSIEVDEITSVEAGDLQNALAEIADSFDVTGFKCVKCGLAHMHDTTKHRLSDTFDFGVDSVDDVEYNPNCHCGVQEAARHGSDMGIDESRATDIASSAPIPDEATREMNESFGTL